MNSGFTSPPPRALAAGDSATAPAGMHHFSIAKGRTVLSVTFMGPYTITYLRAEDASRRPVFSLRLLRHEFPLSCPGFFG